MSVEAFLDTNLLLYSCSAADADIEKRRVCSEIIFAGDFGLSSQVLQEFIANALRKPSLGITESSIDATLELATHVPVQPVNLELIIQATTLRRRFQLSHWDSTIVAAARELGCRILYSEVLRHGREFEQMRVVNPFS